MELINRVIVLKSTKPWDEISFFASCDAAGVMSYTTASATEEYREYELRGTPEAVAEIAARFGSAEGK